MLRPTLLLSATLFATLLIAGRDTGQLRPGLARAEANGQPVIALTRSFSPTVAVTAAAPPQKSTLSDLPPPVELIAAPTIGNLAEEKPRAAEPEPQPVFTLSALPGLTAGNAGPVPGETPAPEPSLYADPSDGGRLAAGTELQPLEEAVSPVADLRVVQASSANVRISPSTEGEVVGRLYSGEVVRVIGTSDSEWVEVSIEGDGIQGFVASRLLLSIDG